MSEFNLKPNKSAIKSKKRLGRGISSGKGKTCSKGHKGQKARAGSHLPYVGFEGGQMPIYRRLPKRGFKSRNKNEYSIINIANLDVFNDGEDVTLQTLIEKGLIDKKSKLVKILADGDINKKLTIKVNAVSNNAKEKLEASGSSIEIIK